MMGNTVVNGLISDSEQPHTSPPKLSHKRAGEGMLKTP